MFAGILALWIIVWFLSKKKQPPQDIYHYNQQTDDDIDEEELETLPTTIFRPKTFKEYIGQEKAKEIISQYIKGTKSRNRIYPHTLIHGKAGMGKTTLGEIIANQLGVSFKEYIASNLENISDLVGLFKNINGGILFLDEIHSLDREIAEKFYRVMEDFKFDNNLVKPFTLIGATTELGEILKNRKPFYDRFKIIIELQDYTIEELVKIAKQYKNRLFNDDKIIQISKYSRLAENCRGNPRHIIRLLEATIYFDNNVNQVFKNFGIIKNGYTEKDLKILKYLAENNIVGLQGLASYLDTSMENYLFELEPYLLKTGLLNRTPRGRNITSKGIKMLKELLNYLKAN